MSHAWENTPRFGHVAVGRVLRYCSTGSCHCPRWDKSSCQWGRNQMLKRFQTASENKKCKGFICYLSIIFPLKFQDLLKKINYYVLNLWAELKEAENKIWSHPDHNTRLPLFYAELVLKLISSSFGNQPHLSLFPLNLSISMLPSCGPT